jgi:hypothetical protein
MAAGVHPYSAEEYAARNEGGRDEDYSNLVRLSANLLSSTLSRQSVLHPALCARLQIEGVALHFSNDVFRLNLALEATESLVY